MPDRKSIIPEGFFMLLVMLGAFGVNLLLLELFQTRSMMPMVFVLGVFLISWKTRGYFWGVTASLLSVLAMNYAFTYPYYAFDLISPECLSSAIVMLIVSVMTGALTTKLKAQEKMKAEAEKERMRGNLLRAVSHDLRTPLTSIYGACSTMLDNYDSLTRQQHLKLLGDVRSDAQWLVRMVENLLSVTRIDAERLRLAKNATVLEELIDAVLVKFRKHYPNQNVTVTIPEDFVTIPMDTMLIQQVLMNLLENAVIHAQGMTKLELTVEICGKYAMFRITDNGCGVDPQKLDSLFTGLHDSAAPADTGRSNMGIGLSVCAAIIKAHGSEIKARNLPEKGMEFSFLLEMEEEIHGK